MVIFPEDKSGPIAEIHKIRNRAQWKELIWNYSPTKRDNLNVERKKYFRKYFGDTEVVISIPNNEDEINDFFQELFSLAENRIKADNIEEITPNRRERFPEGKKIQRLQRNSKNAEISTKINLQFI